MPQQDAARISRKTELRAALVLEGKTVGDFAKECGVSRTHFDEVMDGRRESARIDGLVDDKIAAFRKEVALRQLAS